MKILYISNNCSKIKYENLFKDKSIMILQQAQKFHSLLIDGLNKNGIQIISASGLPVNRKLTKKIYIKHEKENSNGIEYYYYGFFNLPWLRQISIFFKSFARASSFCLSNNKKAIICDVLGISNSAGALFASKIFKTKTIGIVTDVPGFLTDDIKSPDSCSTLRNYLKTKINRYLINHFDMYVFLTFPMNEIINKKNKPYVVIEGFVDINMKNIYINLIDKHKIRVILYAGSLKRIYGIEMLIKAFIKAKLENCELHIYGDGDYVDALREICSTNPHIKYGGVKPNDYIVREEMMSTLLVNPRPTNEEYTKYSFPSKNMEYMVSGTPILTTKLPGMPSNYDKYVYLIDEESVEGLTKEIHKIMNIPSKQLNQMGENAKKFVLENKNNVVQASKILEMIEANYKLIND